MKDNQSRFGKTIEKWEKIKRNRIVHSEELIKELILRIPSVLRCYQVKNAILFGSVLTRQADADSDIDLLVQPLPKEKYWELRFDLEEVLGYPIDLFTQDDDPVLVNKITNRG